MTERKIREGQTAGISPQRAWGIVAKLCREAAREGNVKIGTIEAVDGIAENPAILGAPVENEFEPKKSDEKPSRKR